MRLTKIFVFMLLLTAAVLGQTNRGSISGSVTDPKGDAIPGATVTVTNVGTNQSVTLTTSDSGAFTANSLDPVIYNVTVEASGFKKSVVSKVKVDTGSAATANVVLELGNVAEQVTIQADAPALNTQTGTTGTTITERQLEDVPLSNRSVLDLAITAPNVSGDVGSENPAVTSDTPAPGFNLSLNGGRPGSTTMLADGTNNTGVGIARQVVSLTPETVQEFSVQTSAYSAEFGNTAGGVISATTKSGTNRFTGTALWYHVDPSTNAKKFTTSTVRPPNYFRQNQISFTIGGPVFLPAFGEGGPKIYNGKDKTFFFFAVEPRYRGDKVITDTLVPTAAERTGDFRNLVRTSSGWVPASVAAQFNLVSLGPTTIYNQYNLVGNQLQRLAVPPTGARYCQFGEASTITGGYCSTAAVASDARNVIPTAYLDPVALKALQYIPDASNYFVNGDGLVRNFVVNRFVKQDEVRYTARIDHNFTKNNRANFRFTLVPAIGTKGFGSEVNGNGATYSNSKQFVATDNQVFSASIVNELRLGYTTGTFSDDYSKAFSIIGGRNLSNELGLPSVTSGGLPLFLLSSDSNGYNAFANIGSAGSTNNFNKEKRYTLTDILYLTQGNKTWKFGVDTGDASLNVIPFFGAAGGRFDFRVANTGLNQTASLANAGDSFASYLLGVAGAEAIRPNLVPYSYNWKSIAGFVQNDWKIRQSLTLNLGMRYSLQLPRTEKNNLQGVFRPDLAQTYTLPTPVTLANGQVVTTALVPPFALAGRGGRSKYIFPIDYNVLEPRFGFAWSPKKILGISLEGNTVIRGGYGLSHAPLTGNNRLPSPELSAFNASGATTTATGSTGTANTAYALRLSSNTGVYGSSYLDSTQTQLEQALKIPADGLIYLGSLAISGYSIPDNVKTPNVQNWNLSLSHQFFKNTVVEIAYVGNKGTHLFLPLYNLNPRNQSYILQLDALGAATETSTADPLGRQSLVGTTLSVPIASLGSKYLGFDTLNSYFNTGGNSIRHAGYIDIRRRVARGLAFTANYTYGKSIDDASDASPDKNILTAGNTQGSNFSFGAPRYTDRAVSTYDVKHAFSSTFIIDSPVGRKGHFFKDMPAALDTLLGGWTLSGVFRLQSGYPFLPTIADGNTIGTLTHTIRPDVLAGVPLLNPKYDPKCKTSVLCEPYINPAAFERPAVGSLGNAPRTIDFRGPLLRFFDVSLQKNFKLPFGFDDEGKRKIQIRVDAINALNLKNFRIAVPTSGGGPDIFGSAPSTVNLTQAEYTAWQQFDPANRPAYTAAVLANVNANLANSRNASGVLPLNFFTVPLTTGFSTTNANSFDITTLNGLKLYRLRQVYSQAFGQLRELQQPRYFQFGIKIYF